MLVDASGYQSDNDRHTEVMSLRPAPIQMSAFLYSGSSQTAFHDFLLTDGACSPPEMSGHYSERLALMPRPYTYYLAGHEGMTPPLRHKVSREVNDLSQRSAAASVGGEGEGGAAAGGAAAVGGEREGEGEGGRPGATSRRRRVVLAATNRPLKLDKTGASPSLSFSSSLSACLNSSSHNLLSVWGLDVHSSTCS